MTNDSPVVTEITGSVAAIRFNRPAERNPLSIATLVELETSISFLLAGSINAIIITGTGDVFASGANIRELQQLDTTTAKEFATTGQHVFQMIEEAKALTIAAINGYCMGGALDLALACNVRVASAAAVFAHPGARLGIITGWGGTQRLSRLIGRARALEMFATARRIEADEALRIGIVESLADPVLTRAFHLAENFIR